MGILRVMLGCLALFCVVLAYFWANYSAQVWDALDQRTYAWMIDDCGGSLTIAPQATVTGDVHIAYAADSKHFDALLSSMLSVGRNAAFPGQVVIHIIVQHKDMGQATHLTECYRAELGSQHSRPKVRVHRMKPITAFNVSSFKDIWLTLWPGGGKHLTPLSFAQLYLHEYVPAEAARVVWLSVDTIVRSDIRELYQTPMKTALAAAHDWKSVTWNAEYVKDLREIDPTYLDGIPNMNARVLNSGVLVLDLHRWRSEDVTKKLETLVNNFGGVKITQLVLNLHFKDQYDIIDWRWNTMGLFMTPPPRCLDEARILHWAGPVSPFETDVPKRLQSLYKELMDPYRPARHCSLAMPMLDSDEDINF